MPDNNLDANDPLFKIITDNVEIKTKLDRVITDVKELSDNLVFDVRDLQNNKFDKVDFNKFIQEEYIPLKTNTSKNSAFMQRVIGALVVINALILIGIGILQSHHK